ncbi:MAG: hypothetical protein WBW04_13590 [Nitrolancea sp.]
MLGRALRLLIILILVLCGTASGAIAKAAASGLPVTWHFSDVALSNTSPALGDVESVRFTIVDASGSPVVGLDVKATLNAPTDTGADSDQASILSTVGRSLDIAGHYEVSMALNQPGQWVIRIDAGNSLGDAQLSQIVSVDPKPDGNVPDIRNPVFLQADSWGTVYRLDPSTGSVASFDGGNVVHAGDRWWMTDSQLVPLETPNPLYGGRWELTVSVKDGVTGASISTVDLGAIRASVFIGSTDQPAVATAIALSPDGSRLYAYWARQLGQGWLAWIATADPSTGEVLQQRMLQGSITADSTWARVDVTPDGSQIVLSEQIVRSTSITGYRLTTLDANSLVTIEQFRRSSAPNDPLTHCLIPYSGPTGPVSGTADLRYSLCSPSPNQQDVALVTWNPLTGAVTHQVDLSSIEGSTPFYVDGVSAPDGRHFYAVNAEAQQVAEIDMTTGTISRQAGFTVSDQQSPDQSPIDRFKKWLLGQVSSTAMAGVLIEPGVTIAPDGSSLYLVAPNVSSGNSSGNGIWILDTASLHVTNHILSNEMVAGVVVTPDGQLAVVRKGSDGQTDEISVVQPDGRAIISLALPDGTASANGTH